MEELPPQNYALFKQHEEIIEREISRRKSKWHLDSINHIVWSDIEQLLRLHVLRKIHLWKSEIKPLPNYLHGLLGNRIKNLIRDNYGSMARPCLHCPHFGGGNVCNLFGVQSTTCKEYNKWFNGKRYKLEINFAQSSDATVPGEENDNIKQEIVSKESNFLDFEIKIPEFENLLRAKLKPLEWKAYTYLFIEHKTDLQTAKELNYSTDGGKTSKGYKAVGKLKTIIFKKAVAVTKEMEF